MRALLSLVVAGWLAQAASLVVPYAAAAEPPLPDGLYAVWETPRGSFTAELFYELAPLTVANFVGLTEGTIAFTGRPAGQPFYDGLQFHRVVPGFVVQGGDPLGTGEGNPGHTLADEFTPHLKHDAIGTLSMANGGPNDNGCQFFFTLEPVNRLNYKHSVFGQVRRGLDVLPRIQAGDGMTRVSIVRVGPRAESFKTDRAAFAALRQNTPVIAPRDPALSPLFANEAALSVRDGYDDWINQKLHHYAAVTGVTIRVRLLPKFAPPPPGAGDSSFNPLRILHQQLAGNDARAATLVLVANDPRWRLWLGDGLLERFDLDPGAVGNDPGARQLHDLKQAILAEAKNLWDVPDEPRHHSVDTAVTDLIEALDRPPSLKPTGQ